MQARALAWICLLSGVPAATAAAQPRAATEPRTAEQRATRQRATEQRATEQRASSEQRAAEQRATEQRAAEQRAAEQRATEQRAAEQRAAEQRAAEQRAPNEALLAGRRALRHGQIEEAYALLLGAAESSDEPQAWRALAEVADRLRLERVALRAYQRYLREAPSAADRREIEGRIRVLRQIRAGARYVLRTDEGGRRLFLERRGGPELAGPDGAEASSREGLRGWPTELQAPHAPVVPLAQVAWDGARTREADEPDGAPRASGANAPDPDATSLGRRLSAP